MNFRYALIVFLAVLLALLGVNSVYLVHETERAILLRFGAVSKADVAPGLHFKLPFAEDIKKFDARVLTLDSQPNTYYTQEKKPLIVDSYAKWRVTNVRRFYEATSGDVRQGERLLGERVVEGLRNQISRRDMHEVVSGERDQLMDELTDDLNEVIYNDELFIRIYPGVEPDCQMDPPGPKCDGVMDDDEVLFKDSSTSRTWIEYPIIADVDGDFKAELVIGLGADTSYGQDAGVEVWGDVLDNWVGTRPIWNQHTYHITNVEIDGTIPLVENDSWAFPPQQPFNSYRRNAQGVSSFCAPDLQLFNLQAEVTSCPTLELSVEVANLGCLGAGAGVKVSFYEQELGYLGTVQTQAALPPGASETVTLQTAQVQFEASVWAVVDDDGMGVGELNECDEDNQSDVTVVCMVIG